MTTLQYTSPLTEENLLTTTLNSLADAGRVLSAAFSNDAAGERYLFGDFELDLAVQGTARSAGAYCALSIVYSIDGTNFTYGSASLVPPATTQVGVFLLDAAVTTRIVHLTGIPLRPFDFKVILENQTGQAFASSGTVLSVRRSKLENV